MTKGGVMLNRKTRTLPGHFGLQLLYKCEKEQKGRSLKDLGFWWQ